MFSPETSSTRVRRDGRYIFSAIHIAAIPATNSPQPLKKTLREVRRSALPCCGSKAWMAGTTPGHDEILASAPMRSFVLDCFQARLAAVAQGLGRRPAWVRANGRRPDALVAGRLDGFLAIQGAKTCAAS